MSIWKEESLWIDIKENDQESIMVFKSESRIRLKFSLKTSELCLKKEDFQKIIDFVVSGGQE